jgi:hypothetical protein
MSLAVFTLRATIVEKTMLPTGAWLARVVLDISDYHIVIDKAL